MPDLLIDLDNTIYSETEAIFSQIDLKMKSFISSELNVSLENAYVIQKKYFLKYGTTLRGLMMNHNVKPKYFLKYVHDINLKPIKKNLTLKKEMKKFSGRKIIFTNGTTEHATNVLKKVGVFEEIDSIFDIEDAEYIPKPALLPYKKIVNKYKITPHNAIMIDDIKANLITAKKLKIGTVLISKKKSPLLTNNKIDYVFGDITSIIKKINDKDIFNETR
tara:strand:- start:118 stop:774 length:657 start_codon:yes stop_codon:yes gene_type:complete